MQHVPQIVLVQNVMITFVHRRIFHAVTDNAFVIDWTFRTRHLELVRVDAINISAVKRMFGRASGRCLDGSVGDSVNRGEEERYEYLLKCSLSKDGEKGCPCGSNLECSEKRFPSSMIRYPRRSILAPFLFFLFGRTKNRTSKLPDSVLIIETVPCRNSLITVIEEILPFERDLNSREIIENYFCQSSPSVVRPKSDHPSRQEWCHRANESTAQWSEWNSCMSITRINDGWRNCLNGRDERELTSMEIEKSCAQVRRHRFRCSTEQATCLSVMRFGDEEIDCENRFDESWFGIGRWLSSVICRQPRRDECSLLRQYIDQSWKSTSMKKTDKSSTHLISFRSYCDTFWDLQWREDENLRECQHWWTCSIDRNRCENGQCIEIRWSADGEWDCADASDEQEHLVSSARHALEKASDHHFSDQSYLIPATCPQPRPLFCLSSEAIRQGFSCFNLSQIGDGHIDCAGAFDERNTLEHCSQLSKLGANFRCRSTNTCVPYDLHCLNGHRCANRSDDEHWCSREDHPSNASGRNDFTCFGGQRVESNRCDGYRDCLFTEDEYMCRIRIRSNGLVLAKRNNRLWELESTRFLGLDIREMPTSPSWTRVRSRSFKHEKLFPRIFPPHPLLGVIVALIVCWGRRRAMLRWCVFVLLSITERNVSITPIACSFSCIWIFLYRWSGRKVIR